MVCSKNKLLGSYELPVTLTADDNIMGQLGVVRYDNKPCPEIVEDMDVDSVLVHMWSR